MTKLLKYKPHSNQFKKASSATKSRNKYYFKFNWGTKGRIYVYMKIRISGT